MENNGVAVSAKLRHIAVQRLAMLWKYFVSFCRCFDPHNKVPDFLPVIYYRVSKEIYLIRQNPSRNERKNVISVRKTRKQRSYVIKKQSQFHVLSSSLKQRDVVSSRDKAYKRDSNRITGHTMNRINITSYRIGISRKIS